MKITDNILLLCFPLLLVSHTVPGQNAGTAGSGGPGSPDAVLELTLDDCRQMAMQNNTAVLNAGLDVAAAKARKQEAVAEYFPTVSVNALAFYAFDPLLEIGVTDILGKSDFSSSLENILSSYAAQYGFSPYYSTLKKGVTASVSVVQPLFAGGRIVTGNRMARIGLESASLQQEIKLRETSESVESAYWQIVSLEDKLACLADVNTLLDTIYRDALSASGAPASSPQSGRAPIRRASPRSASWHTVRGSATAPCTAGRRASSPYPRTRGPWPRIRAYKR